MKKRVFALLAMACSTAAVFAVDISVSGEFKTGVYLEQQKIGDADPVSQGMMKNNDGDSGADQGRAQLTMTIEHENIGARVRFQQEAFTSTTPGWDFAYAYGKLLDDQIRLSAGLLGDSPWGTGGPEIRTDIDKQMGVRFEWKPAFAGGLNLGFVLNRYDVTQLKDPKDQVFGEMLQETVFGASYEHEYFAVNLAFRMDSEADGIRKDSTGFIYQEGAQLSYRVEERALGKSLKGMQIWANGLYSGLGATAGEPEYFTNWLYFQYEPENFIAGLNVHFQTNKELIAAGSTRLARKEYQTLEFKPAFYYKFFNNALQAGLGLGLGMEFGDGKTYTDSSYQYWSIEPQVRLNILPGTYLALVVNYTDSYADALGTKAQTTWLNLRAVYTF
jgi:hypothetical protein